MEYYEKKYKVVGYLDKYHTEEEFPEPPPEDQQPEMECNILQFELFADFLEVETIPWKCISVFVGTIM